MIPELSQENGRGWNVFITPIDNSVSFVLVDDLDAAGLDVLTGRGYRPAVVLETSPGNHQAIVKLPKSLEGQAVNEWFKAVNRALGDQKITGVMHPFRLAGFQNRKPKYEDASTGFYPFVRVVEADGGFCPRARAVIEEIDRRLHAQAEMAARPQP